MINQWQGFLIINMKHYINVQKIRHVYQDIINVISVYQQPCSRREVWTALLLLEWLQCAVVTFSLCSKQLSSATSPCSSASSATPSAIDWAWPFWDPYRSTNLGFTSQGMLQSRKTTSFLDFKQSVDRKSWTKSTQRLLNWLKICVFIATSAYLHIANFDRWLTGSRRIVLTSLSTM